MALSDGSNVLVPNLARMYLTERVLDASMLIQSKSCVDDSCPVVCVPGLLNCTFLSDNINKGDTIEYRVPDIVVKNRGQERRQTNAKATRKSLTRRTIRGRILHTGDIGSFFYWMDRTSLLLRLFS